MLGAISVQWALDNSLTLLYDQLVSEYSRLSPPLQGSSGQPRSGPCHKRAVSVSFAAEMTDPWVQSGGKPRSSPKVQD